jgi:plastocyanin
LASCFSRTWFRTAVLAATVLGVAGVAGVAGAGGTLETGEISGRAKLVRLSVGSQTSAFDRVVVYLEGAPGTVSSPTDPLEMTQEGKTFDPGMMVVPVGAEVHFPNLDDLFHNVFSLSPGNNFDLGLYRGGDSRSVRFETPGVAAIYCNIHPQMVAHVLVVDNPHNPGLEGDGTFRLEGVPPGIWQAVAWFPFGDPVRQEVRVEPGQTTELRFVLRERGGATRHLDKHGERYGGY